MLFDSNKIFFYCAAGILNPPETARDKDFKLIKEAGMPPGNDL
jgi:hypothetical protein